MKRSLSIIASIVICLFVGLIASYLQNASMASWYPTLDISPLTPPSLVFPIVWSILYVLMGISIGLIVSSRLERRKVLLLIFAIQLTLNFLWSFTFFFLESPLAGFIIGFIRYSLYIKKLPSKQSRRMVMRTLFGLVSHCYTPKLVYFSL